MMQGFDCATPLTQELAARFKTGGHEFVARYLVPSGWKALTKSEAEAISATGLQIISVFETTANRPLGGREAGLIDGAIAVRVAAEVGQPEGSCIYTAVDFEPTSGQMQTVIEYVQAFNEATPGFSTGVYGCYGVIIAVNAAGVCDKYWQTYAWSNGQKTDWINLYQYRNDIKVNGIGIDFNMAYGDEGAWSIEQPVAFEPEKKTTFTDVEAGRWSEDVIWVANYHGIMTGFEGGTFRPTQPVTREELAAAVNALLVKINSK